MPVYTLLYDFFSFQKDALRWLTKINAETKNKINKKNKVERNNKVEEKAR